MECNQVHKFYPIGEAEEDGEEEGKRKAQRELDDWVEGQSNSDELAFCNGNNEMVKSFNQKFNLF